MKFELVDNYNDFLKLEEKWNKLVENLDNPQLFYSWKWVKTYLEEVDVEFRNNLAIVVGYEKKDINIIIPFINQNKTLRFITNKTVDYNTLLIDKYVNKYIALDKALEFLISKVDFKKIELSNFRAESELYILQDIINQNNKLKIIIQDSVMAPALILKDKNTKMKKKAIKDIIRREKKLSELGTVHIKVGAEFNKEVWDKLKEFHCNRWPHSIFKNDKYLNFYEKYMKENWENVEFSYIELNQQPIAIHFGFKDENKVYYYIPAYDEQYTNYGVGAILLNSIIEHYSEKKEFDFLRGNEPYKFNWTDKIEMNFEVYIFKKDLKGNLDYLICLFKLISKKSRSLRKLLNK